MAEFPVRANTKGAVDDIDQLIAALRKAGKEAGLTEKQIDDITSSTRKARTEGAKNINGLNDELKKTNNTLKTVGQGLLSLFALDQVKQFIGQVVSVTSEFQKLEAVLTNTLGSKSEAQRSLRTIQDIAAKTPFSVLQLTQSYIKLVNQGFKPTAAEIIKLGDLAASTGKEFDMLTEAIIDAQTGEFERLKEFGIRASKAGDKVTFTFKGVQTQADFTSESIRNYILSLGDAVGVSGSMEAISNTLGGQISNLGDSWDTLLKTIGEGNKGYLSDTVSLFKELIDAATILSKTDKQMFDEKELALQTMARENIEAELKSYKNLDDARKLILEQLDAEELKLRLRNDEMYRGINYKKEEYQANFDRIDQIRREKEALDDLITSIKNDQEARARREKEEEKKRRMKELEKATFELSGIDEKAIEIYKRQNKELAENAELIKRLNAVKGEASEIDLPSEQGVTDEMIDWAKKRVDARKDAAERARDYEIQALNEVLRTTIVNTQVELAMLDKRYQTELQLAGDNEKAKSNIELKFNSERNKLLKRQAEQEQMNALFSIAVNQGPAIAKTAAQLGFPAAIPFIAAVGLLFALQLQNTKKLAQARYAADGDYDIDGPGTETSDSIPYMLSKHETVVHAKGTRKFGALLQPIVEDKNLSWGDIRSIVDAHLPTELVRMRNQTSDIERIGTIEELRAIKRAITQKQETRLQFDEHGFSYWVGSQGQWTKYVSNRYRTS